VEIQASLAIKAMAHDAWEDIRQVRLGADRVKEVNIERLRREFNDIAFKAGETIKDFGQQITNLTSQLRILGDKVSNKEVIKNPLHIIPGNLEQVAICMETMLDLDMLSVEEDVEHLHAVEQ
jgi:hypothetical protein